MNNLKFTHISKTSGTTICQLGKKISILWGRHDNIWQLILKNSNINVVDYWHIPLSFCKNQKLKDQILSEYSFFTCVRNPYDRLISEYYCKYGNGNHIVETSDELNNFIQKKLVSMLEMKFTKFAHFIPQYHYVFEKDYKYVNKIIKFENIKNDFDKLMNDQNIEIKFNFKERLEKKLDKHFLYSNTIDFIKKVYEKDFSLFDYDINLKPLKKVLFL